MTLVEVLAGVALMGTLLVAVLIAGARCRRQTASARARLRADRAAETLLSEWWGGSAGVPRDASGRVDGPGELTWRTETVANADAERLGLEVVRLTVSGGDGAGKASIHVDVVVPDEPEQDRHEHPE